MKKFSRIAMAAAIATISLAGAATAQDKFDPSQFFQELQKQGVQTPQNFDGKKFFDDLATRSAQAKLDPKEFFEELQKQGAQMPQNFDGKKFFDDLAKTGAKLPPMVMTN